MYIVFYISKAGKIICVHCFLTPLLLRRLLSSMCTWQPLLVLSPQNRAADSGGRHSSEYESSQYSYEASYLPLSSMCNASLALLLFLGLLPLLHGNHSWCCQLIHEADIPLNMNLVIIVMTVVTSH